MIKLNVNFDENVPIYTCTNCSNCTSLFGKSLSSITNRGCCFYFPKFNLLDIHKMSKSYVGLNVLSRIISNKNTEIFHYYIHAKGTFDKKRYYDFISNISNKDFINSCKSKNIEDMTIFFRTCPFVKSNYGCTLPQKFRSPICNFFICKEVKEALDSDTIKIYEQESINYWHWYDWENKGLECLLKEQQINLKNNLYECLKTLRDLPFYEYNFPKLPSIDNIKIKMHA